MTRIMEIIYSYVARSYNYIVNFKGKLFWMFHMTIYVASYVYIVIPLK